MKKSLILFAIFFSVMCCTNKDNYINSAGAIPGGYYFKFADAIKQSYFQNQSIVIVNTVNQMQYKLEHNLTGAGATSENSVFRLFSNLPYTKEVFLNGVNKFNIVYPDGSVDKLELDITFSSLEVNSGGIVTYNKIIFNNKEIVKETVNEPANPSYLFILK